MPKQTMLIDAHKLLEWLRIREEEAYHNATQTLSPSFFKGKAEGFKDVADYLDSGLFDPTPPVQPDTMVTIGEERAIAVIAHSLGGRLVIPNRALVTFPHRYCINKFYDPETSSTIYTVSEANREENNQ